MTAAKKTSRAQKSLPGKMAGQARRVMWKAAGAVVMHPRAAAGLTLAVPAFSPVTLREVAGVWLAGCAATGSVMFLGGGSPKGEPSLQDIAKFRKQARAARSRFVHVMADAHMVKADVDGAAVKRQPRLRRITSEPLGICLTIDARRVSKGVGAFRDQAETIRAGFNANAIKVDGSGSHDICVHLRYRMPAHFGVKPVRTYDLPKAAHPTRPFTSLSEDCKPLTTDATRPSLVVGAMGSGKSVHTWTTLYQLLAANVPVRLAVFDPKGGMELGALEHAAYQFEDAPERWPKFLSDVATRMQGKMYGLRKRGITELVRFTERDPLDVIIIDELVTALSFGTGKTSVQLRGQKVPAPEAFRAIMTTMRSAGMTVLASTQLPQKEVLGPIRDTFRYVTLLGMGEQSPEAVRTVLNASADLYPAHELPTARELAGQGFRRDGDTGEIVRMRGALLTKQQKDEVVQRIGEWTARFRARDPQPQPASAVPA